MLYFIFITILVIYFILLYKNIGEITKIDINNVKIGLSLTLLLLLISIIFINDSNIGFMDEYKKISTRHEKIRDNIKMIKNNIPILKTQVSADPTNFKGHVMLGKSYMLLNDYLESARSFSNAYNLSNSDPDLLNDYIFVLRKIDAKKNKTILISLFNDLILTDINNLEFYNLYLNYLFEINDVERTKKILIDIIKNPNITKKESYERALLDLNNNTKERQMIEIKLSDNVIDHLQKSKNIFFILRSDTSTPIAVKRLSSSEIVSSISISDNNVMINNGKNFPDKMFLSIKTSKEKFVNKDMKTVYESDLISLKGERGNEIFIKDIISN